MLPWSIFYIEEKAFSAGVISICCEENMYPNSALRKVRASRIATREGIWSDTWEDEPKIASLRGKDNTLRQRESRTSANPLQKSLRISVACLLLAFVALVQNWCRLDLLLLHMSIKSFRRVARLFPLCPVQCSVSPTPSEHAQITLETDACSAPLFQCCPLSVTDAQALRKPPPSLSLLSHSPSNTRIYFLWSLFHNSSLLFHSCYTSL